MAVTAPGSDLWVLSTPEGARADAKSVTSSSKSVTHGRPHDSDDTLGASFSPALTLERFEYRTLCQSTLPAACGPLRVGAGSRLASSLDSCTLRRSPIRETPMPCPHCDFFRVLLFCAAGAALGRALPCRCALWHLWLSYGSASSGTAYRDQHHHQAAYISRKPVTAAT